MKHETYKGQKQYNTSDNVCNGNEYHTSQKSTNEIPEGSGVAREGSGCNDDCYTHTLPPETIIAILENWHKGHDLN